jgi:signal transduction histidine kinase/ActR/RegA family two-component response regulator
MERLGALLDERFVRLSLAMAGRPVARVVTAVITATLMSLTVGLGVAAAWVGGFALSEFWLWAARRPFASGAPGTTLQRLHLAIAGGSVGVVWVAVSTIYWLAGTAVLQFVGVCGLATILLAGQTQAMRSPTMLVIVTVPPMLALMVLSLGFSGFHGMGVTLVVITLATLVAHLTQSVLIQLKESAALDALQREAVAASHAKSAFLAMMSHEIRTPMNGVLGMAQALAHTSLDDAQRRQVGMLMASGEGLMTILNDILDLSKIEAGRMTLETTVFDLHDLVEGVAALWLGAAREKGLGLDLRIAPDAPRWVRGDPTRVRQILANHLSNAVKFTAAGSVCLELSPLGEGRVRFVVRDTGIGLTAEQQAGLFQPFAQADVSITRRFGGTGLGLSISRQLVAMMGGEIELDSIAGQGSAFTITLALPAAAAPLAAAEAPAGEVELGQLRVLVAEDNAINQAVVQSVLGAVDALVDVAGDGAEALQRLAEAPYDVVLMDIHMPNVDGVEALRRLRAGEAGAAAAALPVIALTADAMTTEVERFIALGFDAVEPKPIQAAKLIQAIASVLSQAPEPAVAPVAQTA